MLFEKLLHQIGCRYLRGRFITAKPTGETAGPGMLPIQDYIQNNCRVIKSARSGGHYPGTRTSRQGLTWYRFNPACQSLINNLQKTLDIGVGNILR